MSQSTQAMPKRRGRPPKNPSQAPAQQSQRQRDHEADEDSFDAGEAQRSDVASTDLQRKILARIQTLEALMKGRIDGDILDDDQQVQDEAIRQIKAHRAIYPSLNDDELRDVLNTSLKLRPEQEQLWTEEDEEKLEKEFNGSAIRDKISQVSSINYYQLKSLYVSCLQYMACTPLDVLSPSNNLAYEGLPPTDPKAVVWTGTFAQAMHAILIHPLWRDGAWPALVIALQFAVILRTDDRRPWRFDAAACTADTYLLVMQTRANEEGRLPKEQRKSMAEICMDVRNNPGTSRWGNSEWQLFFEALVSIVNPNPVPKLEGPECYPVRQIDLQNITTALGRLEVYNLPSAFSAAGVPGLLTWTNSDVDKAIISRLRSSPSEPRQYPSFRKILTQAAMKLWREARIRSTQPPPAAVPVPANPAPAVPANPAPAVAVSANAVPAAGSIPVNPAALPDIVKDYIASLEARTTAAEERATTAETRLFELSMKIAPNQSISNTSLQLGTASHHRRPSTSTVSTELADDISMGPKDTAATMDITLGIESTPPTASNIDVHDLPPLSEWTRVPPTRVARLSVDGPQDSAMLSQGFWRKSERPFGYHPGVWEEIPSERCT